MRYGFLDESGDAAYTDEAGDNLVVVVVVVGHPERLRKVVTKARKGLGRGLGVLPELKAADSDPRLVGKLLTCASKIGFEAVAVVIHKSTFPRPQDSESLYRYACARAAREAVERFGLSSLTMDRRYTKRKLRDRLDQAITSGLRDLGVNLAIHHEDSKKERALQVADAVAWALFQRHERKEEMFWRIIRGSVVEVRL